MKYEKPVMNISLFKDIVLSGQTPMNETTPSTNMAAATTAGIARLAQNNENISKALVIIEFNEGS